MQLREKVSSGKIVSAVATSGEEKTDASEFYGSDCVCADGAYSGFASLDYLRRIEPQQQSFASSGAGRFGRGALTFRPGGTGAPSLKCRLSAIAAPDSFTGCPISVSIDQYNLKC